MGAPFKGKEVTQAQLEARLKLSAFAKSRRYHKNYLGPDEQGRSTYRAECGHVVWNPRGKRCWSCRHGNKPTDTNEFLGRDDKGWSWFRARSCGHIVHGARTKQCRKCWTDKRDREAFRLPIADRKTNYRTVGNKKEHILIVETVLGRKLKTGEVVHHINMDHTDNRHCNLLVCSKDYHRLLHYRMQLATAQRIRAQQGVA